MNDERIKCPDCSGLRCYFISTSLSAMKKEEYCYGICNDYRPDLENYKCDKDCLLECLRCRGTGYIPWIDSMFCVDEFNHKLFGSFKNRITTGKFYLEKFPYKEELVSRIKEIGIDNE